MLILTAPGQGAQTPGFLSPWLEIPSVAEHIGAWSELAGRDLTRLGTTGDTDEITGTAVAQPLLVAAALAVAALMVPFRSDAKEEAQIVIDDPPANFMEAIARGTSDGNSAWRAGASRQLTAEATNVRA